jgi:hypothetical protein
MRNRKLKKQNNKKKGIRMSIKIEVKRILDRGDKVYEVKKIEALTFDELPSRYTSLDNTALYLKETALCFAGCYEKKLISEGCVYTLDEFTEALEAIKKAGKMLADINKQLAVENAGWEGVEETFII